MAVFLMANFLDLNGIKWIYSNLSNVILIALIVIFQRNYERFWSRRCLSVAGKVSDPRR
ncbi:MAG: hypothetical protein R2875_06790 [Desulfobacterales bacterium]